MGKKLRRVGNTFQLVKYQAPAAIGWASAGVAQVNINLITPNSLNPFWGTGSDWNLGDKVFLNYIEVSAKMEIGTEGYQTRNRIVVFKPRDRTNGTEFTSSSGAFSFQNDLTWNATQLPQTSGGGYDLDMLRFNSERVQLLRNVKADIGTTYQYAPLTTAFNMYPNKTFVTRKFRIPYNQWIKNEIGSSGAGSDWQYQAFMRDPSKNVYLSFLSNNANFDGNYPYYSYSAIYHFTKYN